MQTAINKKKWVLVYFFIILAGLCIAYLIHKKTSGDYNSALERYKIKSYAEAKDVSENVRDVTNQIYQNIRTISLLPSVRNIDRYGQNLNSDGHKTIQEIYNNLASSVAVSEVYIVPHDLDPDKLDPVTKKPQEPIIMFDQLIVGRSQNNSAGYKQDLKTDPDFGLEPLEETEIYEYRLLREQLGWFKKNFPTIDKINGIKVPIISGKEVITCDNTRFSRVTKLDTDRSGLVFSVPFYGPDGTLKGSVSAIILSLALKDILPKANYALVNTAYSYAAMSKNESQTQKSYPWITQNKPDPRLLFSATIPIATNDPQSQWSLWVGYPNEQFLEKGEIIQIRNLKYSSYISLGIFVILSLTLVALVQRNVSLIKTKNLELEGKVEDRTKELKTALDLAESATKTKGEFLANMSHEIRTPMNGVLGMLDLLKDTTLSFEQQDLIDTAANSAEALLAVINDILDFSKLEAGKIQIDVIEFNLRNLIEEVCSLMASRTNAKGLELNCFIPVSLGQRWLGDPTRIRQVLVNLVGNAVKFTDQGEVSVTVIEAMADDESSMICIGVKDTGIGIAAAAQKQLFQPFTQADTSTARRFGGTGLGLSICHDLVKLMGGTIGLESELEQGSLFWFELPLKPVLHESTPSISDFAGLHALIVDDNANNRKILRHYLEHWGFVTEEVDNAPAGLHTLEASINHENAFHLILSDLHMPGMDGLTFLQAVNDNPSLSAIPRLLLSSGGLLSEEERKRLNISQSLLKPVRQSQFLDAIIYALRNTQIERPKAATAVGTSVSFVGKKLLVVEDNKVNQKVVISLLGKLGVTPTLAENGQEALTLVEQHQYDLILMDCQMPIMDGYEATRLIRASEIANNTPRVTIAALTAHAMESEREKCISVGMDDYLSKPIERHKLVDLLSRWLDNPDVNHPINDNTISQKNKMTVGIWDKNAALKRLDDDEELLVSLVEVFLSEAPARVSDLNKALEKNNLQELANAAHAIKGMGGHFCAEPMVSLAKTLEDAARTSQHIDYVYLSENLAAQATELANELKDWVGHDNKA